MNQNSDFQQFLSPLQAGEAVELPIDQETRADDIDTRRDVQKTPSEHQLEQFISDLLKYGVLIATAIVVVGGVLYLIHHGAEPVDYQYFRGEPSVFRSPIGVVKAISLGRYRGIIQLGLLVLIATPIIRVVFSLLTFLRQRDFIYVAITSFVLTGLIYGLVGAYL